MRHPYKKLLLTTLILIGLNNAFAENSENDGNEWTLRKSSHDIAIYTREDKESPINTVRAEGVFSASPDTIAKLLLAINKRKDWDSMCQEITLIEQSSADNRRIHLLYDMPWPVSDRDMVVETTVVRDGSRVRIRSIAINTSEFRSKRNIIRVTEAQEDWLIEPTAGGKTQVTAIIFLDPAGPIPAWMINMLSVNQPYDIMSKLQELSLDEGSLSK